jgi:hypothetical protein
MKEFASFADMALHLVELAAVEELALHQGLKKCVVAIEKTAKAEIGTYQPEAGSFNAWPELSDSTKKDRVQKGFTENDPLERTHALEESISHEISGNDGAVGSDSDVMVYQEIGTPTIPPRPVLGPAALRNKDLIIKTMGAAAAAGVLYGSGETLTLLED